MILITGGLGNIGSHTVVKLLQQNKEIIIPDNLYNSKAEVIDSIETITGKRPFFYQADLLDIAGLEKIFKENKIDCVIYFAGYKALVESVANPLMYFNYNITDAIQPIDDSEKIIA